MGFLDRVRENIQDTATLAREGMEDLQTKRELGQAYGELGRRAFELIESGGLQSDELAPEVDRIRKLKAELETKPAGSGSEA